MKNIYSRLIEGISEPFRRLAPSEQVFLENHDFYLDRVTPTRTLSLSLTDTTCHQNCAHCNGHYLKGMQPFSRLSQVDLNAYDAVLISGGSSKSGEVPIKEHISNILQLPKRLQLNLHPGYQNAENLLPLASRNPVVSFDLPGNDSVISEVFGLPYSCADYRRLFTDYCKKFKTVAHITIGLNYGTDSGEEDTIDFLAEQKPAEVVFLVFRPTPGTRMQNAPVPELARVIDVLKKAQKSLTCPVLLGCMRPSGLYRRDLDLLAWMHGVRKIVMPDHTLLQTLNDTGIKVNGFGNCCALNC